MIWVGNYNHQVSLCRWEVRHRLITLSNLPKNSAHVQHSVFWLELYFRRGLHFTVEPFYLRESNGTVTNNQESNRAFFLLLLLIFNYIYFSFPSSIFFSILFSSLSLCLFFHFSSSLHFFLLILPSFLLCNLRLYNSYLFFSSLFEGASVQISRTGPPLHIEMMTMARLVNDASRHVAVHRLGLINKYICLNFVK